MTDRNEAQAEEAATSRARNLGDWTSEPATGLLVLAVGRVFEG